MQLRDFMGYFIVNTGRKLTLNLTQLFQPYNLTSEQWSLLLSLHHNDGITQKGLAERTEKDPANVTRILDQLERKGLVRRQANPEDRRSFNMRITPAGSEVALKLIPIEQRFMEEILSGIPEQEIEVFRSVLGSINQNIERRREPAQ